jgi:hypothetical protein
MSFSSQFEREICESQTLKVALPDHNIPSSLTSSSSADQVPPVPPVVFMGQAKVKRLNHTSCSYIHSKILASVFIKLTA